MLPASIAVAAFLVAALLIAVHPRGLDEGLAACALAVIDLVGGAVSPVAGAAALRDTLPVLVFFAVLLGGVALLARTKLLGGVVSRLASLAGGDPVRLLALVLGLAALVSVVGTNDATALILPVAVGPLILLNRLPPAPYILGMAFVANSASVVLPSSNPATLLALVHLHVSPLAAAPALALAGLLATGATIGAVVLLSRRPLRGAVLARIVTAEDAPLRGGAPWSLLALVAGFTILVTGLEETGVTASLAGAVRGVSAPLAGVAASIAANLLNNLPTAIAVGSVVPHTLGFELAVIVGADLGPNLTPLGSLSNLLILAAARRAGIEVSWRQFVLWGLLLGPLTVAAGLGAVRAVAG